MSYTNQTTSSMADFISKLDTFLSGTPGWTTVHTPGSGEWSARKTGAGFDIAIATQWDTGSPNTLGIYQWHGAVYNGGASPWAQNDDSGGGAASTSEASLALARKCIITDTPVQFWCFEDDNYFHVVVQIDTDDFRHFGAGVLTLFNDWTGGEYVYGHRQDTNFTGANGVVVGNNTQLLDGRLADTTPGINNAEDYAATIHVTGMDNQVASGMYAVCMGNQASVNLGNDRQAAPKARLHFLGGYGAGPFARFYSQFRGTKQRSLSPMWPIIQFYWNRTTDDLYGPMSQMPDVRGMNIRNFTAGEELVIGSDTWMVFPTSRKSIADVMTGTGFSGYQGIAYKKVTT